MRAFIDRFVRRRHHTIRHLRETRRSLGGTLLAAILFAVIGAVIIYHGFFATRPPEQQTWENFLRDMYGNGGAELLGIALTVLVIETLNERRAIRQRRDELILQMGSPDHAFAIEAVRLLRHKGWLYNGSLRGSALWRANLRSGDLGGANLREAHLWRADLRGANLTLANLQGAGLFEANLHGAYLRRADLRDAVLCESNLEGAHLLGARLTEKTSLPDGTAWTPSVDLERFTNPQHPHFWRSDNPRSPAYRRGAGAPAHEAETPRDALPPEAEFYQLDMF